jgi:hypothetical protein
VEDTLPPQKNKKRRDLFERGRGDLFLNNFGIFDAWQKKRKRRHKRRTKKQNTSSSILL